jgi:uncharacterized protein (DUF342 family)
MSELSFLLDNKSKKLIAIFKYTLENKEAFTFSLIREKLTEENLDNLFFPENSLHQLTKMCNESIDSFQLEIGELKDASCTIDISLDEMTATLLINPAFGGKPLMITDIKNSLKQAGIIYGVISDQEMEQRLQENASNFIIASGLIPIDGIDTQFVSLVPDIIERPQIEDDCICDFRNISSIVIVQEGDALMRRIPSVQGEKGYNVFGKLLNCYNGIEIPFSQNLQGVCIAPDDTDVLLSTLTGTATLIQHGIIVLPLLVVDEVSLKTGNIDFAGSVVVLGNVEAGMKISALNDVNIEGNVESASIECGGILTVYNFVQNSSLRANKNVFLQGGANSTKITSHASINVTFSEYSHIEAGLNITIGDFSLNSNLFAGNRIAVGQITSSRQNKKSIIGGIAWAMLEIKAKIIGVNTEVPTIISVGSNPNIQQRVDELDNLIAENDKKQKQINNLFEHINVQKSSNDEFKQADLQKKLKLNFAKLLSERESYDIEYLKLHENTEKLHLARVVADKNVHVGCEIQISGLAHKIREPLGQSIFRNIEGEITVTNKLSSLIRNAPSIKF